MVVILLNTQCLTRHYRRIFKDIKKNWNSFMHATAVRFSHLKCWCCNFCYYLHFFEWYFQLDDSDGYVCHCPLIIYHKFFKWIFIYIFWCVTHATVLRSTNYWHNFSDYQNVFLFKLVQTSCSQWHHRCSKWFSLKHHKEIYLQGCFKN